METGRLGLLCLAFAGQGFAQERQGLAQEQGDASLVELAARVAELDDRAAAPTSGEEDDAPQRDAEVLERLRSGFEALASRIQGETLIDDDVRAFLRRDDAAEVVHDRWLAGGVEGDALRYVLDRTRLGYALHRADDGSGSWWVNPHARSDVDLLLQSLSPVVESAPRTTDPATVLRELSTDGSRVTLDLDELAFDPAGLDLFRSSAFFNPRTRGGLELYDSEFEDHHAARLFGTWNWSAKVSQDEADLVARFRARGPWLESLARTHDKVIVHISGVPPWLSSHDGDGRFEGGGWSHREAHMPRDLETWERIVRELATVFREAEGTERYYEFWNEPDLDFWRGTAEEFLDLYAVTARAIRDVDPDAKIGGCAVNQWDGKVHGATGSDVLNHELIRRAARDDLPLDFVSWHHFGRPIEALAEARASYVAEWERVGLEGTPELLITEWTSHARGTRFAPARFADLMLALRDARVDAQTVSAWEDFHAKPDPRSFPPWGMVTQQGHRKGRWYVHRMFDRVARGSQGVAVVRHDDVDRTILVSREEDDVVDLLVWQKGSTKRAAAARESLKADGFTGELAYAWAGSWGRFLRALEEDDAAPEEWEDALAKAREVFAGHPIQTSRLVVEFAGAESIEVLECEVVRMTHGARAAATYGDLVALRYEPEEVLRLVLRVR